LEAEVGVEGPRKASWDQSRPPPHRTTYATASLANIFKRSIRRVRISDSFDDGRAIRMGGIAALEVQQHPQLEARDMNTIQ